MGINQDSKLASEEQSGCCMPMWLIIVISILAVAGIVVIIWLCCGKSTEKKLLALAEKVKKGEQLTPAEVKEGVKLYKSLKDADKDEKRLTKFLKDNAELVADLQKVISGPFGPAK